MSIIDKTNRVPWGNLVPRVYRDRNRVKVGSKLVDTSESKGGKFKHRVVEVIDIIKPATFDAEGRCLTKPTAKIKLIHDPQNTSIKRTTLRIGPPWLVINEEEFEGIIENRLTYVNNGLAWQWWQTPAEAGGSTQAQQPQQLTLETEPPIESTHQGSSNENTFDSNSRLADALISHSNSIDAFTIVMEELINEIRKLTNIPPEVIELVRRNIEITSISPTVRGESSDRSNGV